MTYGQKAFSTQGYDHMRKKGKLMKCFQLLTAMLIFSYAISDENQSDIPEHHSTTSDKVVTVEWSVPSKEFNAGDLILATLTLTNNGKEPITIFTSNEIYTTQPSVTRKGKPVSQLAYYIFLMSHPRSRIISTLNPGSSEHLYIPLSRAYDISLTGDYQATAKIYYAPKDKWDEGIAVNTKPIGFTVVGVDYSRLSTPGGK